MRNHGNASAKKAWKSYSHRDAGWKRFPEVTLEAGPAPPVNQVSHDFV